jgi:SAM-dependent methyltransferase
VTDAVGAGYDAVYAAWRSSPTFHAIWDRNTVDDRYPAGFEHISFLTFDELTVFVTALQLGAGRRLVDVACGAGGPGLWVAQQTRAPLTGIDLSRVGVAVAAQRAVEHGIANASFLAASVTAIPLTDEAADAVMSVDAVQYVPDKRAAFAEIHRILRPGGRLVFTAFELDSERVAGLPVLGDDPVGDYTDGLEAVGLRVDRYDETPSWHERLHDAYGAIVSAEPELAPEMGEAAFGALLLEMTLTLDVEPYRKRVLVTASKPS